MKFVYVYLVALFSFVAVNYSLAEEIHIKRPIRKGASATTEKKPESGGKTFQESYRAALQRSEIVATQKEAIKQAEQTYNQAIGAVLPTVSGVGTYQIQEHEAAGLGNIYPNPSTMTKLVATQPLFQGFKEFAGLRLGKDLVQASTADKKQAATQLYLDAATSFFAVAAAEHDIANVIDELGYYDERIKELKQFRAIGRSQVTDLLTAQAQRASLQAQLKQLQGQLRAQRAALAFLTGWDPSTPIEWPIASESYAAKPLEQYLSRLDSRPDVQGDAERVRAAEEGIPIARAGHFPTLGVQGDYYLQRTGGLSDVHWDALLNVSLPIFSGGIVKAQVETAVSKRDQAELQLSRTKRLAEQQIRQFFENYEGDHETVNAYLEATQLAEKNYREEVREYRLGLVTNLDVLTSLTTFQESKRSYDKARYAMLMDIEDVEAAAAYRPEKTD